MLSSVLQVNLLDEVEVDEDSMVRKISSDLWNFLIISKFILIKIYFFLQCEIEGYYNTNEKTVYLHLRGLLDTYTLLSEYDKFTENQDCKDFLSIWAHMRDRYAKALLVLFHISHVIVLTHPTHTFDYSYVHLFRAMDVLRLVSEINST